METKHVDLSLWIRRHLSITWEVVFQMHLPGPSTDRSSHFFWGLDSDKGALQKFPPQVA